MAKMTQAFCANLKKTGKYLRFPVDGCDGLKFVMNQSGGKSWMFRYGRGHGGGDSEKSYTIGWWPEMGILLAKDEANRFREHLRQGLTADEFVRLVVLPPTTLPPPPPPKPEPTPPETGLIDPMQKAAPKPGTLAEVAEKFYSDWVVVRNKPSYIEQQRWRLDKYILPVLGDMKVEDVDPFVVTAFLDNVTKTSPSNSNHLAITLSKMFNWGRRRFPAIFKLGNPVVGHEKNEMEARNVYLKGDEFKRLGDAYLASTDYRKFGVIFPLLTGARRGIIQNLEAGEYLPAEGIIRFKAGEPGVKGVLTTYVPSPAAPLLGKIPEAGFSEEIMQKGWSRLRKAAGLEHITLHDLRRTFSKTGIALGIPEPMVEIIIGHTQEKLKKTYMIYEEKDLLVHAEKISKHISGLLGLVHQGRATPLPIGSDERALEPDLFDSLVGEPREYEERSGGFLVKVTETPISKLPGTPGGTR